MSLFGDLFGGGKASKGLRRAAEAQRQAYQQTAPYRQVGAEAINKLGDVYLRGTEDFEASPGYDFRFDEGQRALERLLSRRGRLMSGAAGRALTRYGQNMATDEYNQNFNRMAALAGIGQTAVGQGANILGRLGNYEGARGMARQSAYDNTLAGLVGLAGYGAGEFG